MGHVLEVPSALHQLSKDLLTATRRFEQGRSRVRLAVIRTRLPDVEELPSIVAVHSQRIEGLTLPNRLKPFETRLLPSIPHRTHLTTRSKSPRW